MRKSMKTSMMSSGRRILAACAVALLAGCSAPDSQAVVVEPIDFDLAAFASRFEPGSLIGAPRLVECTLSGGASSTCVAVTMPANPETFDMGPWCPSTIRDDAGRGGIWLEGGRVYDVSGSFIENLATFYNDPAWQMFDRETGAINVTDTPEACAAAARPDVDPRYTNYCVQCLATYIEEGLTNTYVIPVAPVAASRVEPRVGHEGVGIAYSGVRLDAPAPVDDILGAYTLAPFDDCGGHVNPVVGYHIHAVTDCLRSNPSGSAHGAEIGLSLDGYPLYARLDAAGGVPGDLDACLGHDTADEGYHYHVGDAGSNAILGCHRAQTGCVLSDPDASCDATQTGRRGGPPPGRGRGRD